MPRRGLRRGAGVPVARGENGREAGLPRQDADRDGFVRMIRRRRRLARILARLRRFPRRPGQAEVHDATFRSDAEAVGYAYALRNDHLPDLERPEWLIEKIRWQFLHHPNPLMTLCRRQAERAGIPAF